MSLTARFSAFAMFCLLASRNTSFSGVISNSSGARMPVPLMSLGHSVHVAWP